MLRGKRETRAGNTPNIGSTIVECELVNKNFEVVNLNHFNDKPLCIYTFPTVEIKKCLENLKRLNEFAKKHRDINFVCLSLDIPFTLNRVVTGYKLENIHCLSDFRTREFGVAFGLLILDGILAGMLADSCMLINTDKKITYLQNLAHLERDLNWQEIEGVF